jgi:hypothetical protein
VGTTTPWKKLSVSGDLALTGAIFDSTAAAGLNGNILQSTGNATKWVATSTLGLGNGTFLGLSDTLSAYSANRIPYESVSKITDSSNFTFDGTTLTSPLLSLTNTTGTSSIPTGQGFTVGGSQLVVQQGSGNVGIGTASPSAPFDIVGGVGSENLDVLKIQGQNAGVSPAIDFNNAASAGTNILRIGSGGSTGESWFDSFAGLHFGTGNAVFETNERMTITTAGNVGIGTTIPYSRFTLWGPDTASSTAALTIANNASTTEFQVFDGGNAQLAGTLTQNSDQRLKTNIQSLDASSSLAAIDALNPVTFNWIDPTEGTAPQLGFIAQQVQQLFPALISTTSPTPLTPSGTLGLNYIGLISPIVSAIQALSTEVASLEATVAGFAQSFTSQRGNFTNELCVGSTCVTPAQFQAMVAAATAPAGAQVNISAPAPPIISGTTTPPSINIQGSNPATINVGDTYTDLGAIVTDNQGHDLGYKTFLNGTLVSNIIIDTTQVATDTIDYVATDTWDNTATSTRTVIIEASPSIVPTNEATTTASSSPSASTSTTSTAASTTP